MRISTIIFDLGNVLVDFDFRPALEKVAAQSDLPKEEVSRRAWETSLIEDYERGLIDSPSFFNQMGALLQFQGKPDELREIWSDIFTPKQHHIDLLEPLSLVYPMAILSNTSEAHISFLEARYDFFRHFRERIYSYEVGMVKPEADIYLYALERLNADKYETLFIDDREENVLTPSKMGWQTIHLRPDVDLLTALQSYELKNI